MMRAIVAIVVAGCMPAELPATPVAPPDPMVAKWTIVDHVLAPNAELGESDAFYMHDRVVEITATGYTSPWHGSCGETGRKTIPRLLPDLRVTLSLGDPSKFHLPDDVVEYQLVCTDNNRAPPLTIYLAGDRAVTCWNGACYLLTRRR